MDIITAAEAHRITEEVVCNSYKEALEKATDQIVAAARQGKYSVNLCLNGIISSTTPWSDKDSERFINALENLKYKTQNIRKEPTYPNFDKYLYFVTVSW